MALDKQIHVYSVDTGHFYSNHEKYLHDMNCKYRKERNYLKNQLPGLEKQLLKAGYSKEDIKKMKNNKPVEINGLDDSNEIPKHYVHLLRLIQHKREKAKQSKEQLLQLLSNRTLQNQITKGRDHIRCIRTGSLNDKTIISVFDSSLTRAIGAQRDELIDDLILVQIYYFDVFKDLSFYGFTYKGENYRYFTSSAGQIRKKKAVFIKESTWNKIEKTIMCGLTINSINAKGGNNVNKHLAYMALANSATDVWEEFDIDKAIVIDDFETKVHGTFDYIDDSDYSINRMNDSVPIAHTDGAGMVLPSLAKKNFMFRAPWIKGLLGVFDFQRFILEKNYSPMITDIYGLEHDVIAEDIQIIFTKSQFKMWNYYDSWKDYKQCFYDYHCSAGRCNIEEDRIKNAKINYQMLQTLTNITEEEIKLLTEKSAHRIENICSSSETMKEILGITPYNTNMTPFQKAVKIYPSLLNDTYAKDVIREIKNSLVKKYRSGKLEITGKYTFILPDYYAACEYWFGHIKQPKGLLADQEVFCWLFRPYEKLDCLRSPHLYKEHAVRFNVACQSYGKDRKEKIREWFPTDALYTSTYDLISKILQFDVDGDKSLVVADSLFVKIAERNMKDIVPLYYNMKKASPQPLTSETIYNGLHAAFTGAPIGTDSNDISKIWNSNVFEDGTAEEKEEALKCIKWLCMENNFHIDYAKTLYKPERPSDIGKIIIKYTNVKLPAFFAFAKDKEQSQIQTRNKSFVNKLYDYIPNKAINTRGMNLGKIDYRHMMSHSDIRCSKEVSQLYKQLNRQYRYMINMKDEYANNLRYIACSIRNRFSEIGYSNETIADMLVEYLYGQEKRYKQLLWFCYGQYLLHNLENNIKPKKTKIISCMDCGEWFEVSVFSKTRRCSSCQKTHRKSLDRERKRNSAYPSSEKIIR